jgi:hypothetical protein
MFRRLLLTASLPTVARAAASKSRRFAQQVWAFRCRKLDMPSPIKVGALKTVTITNDAREEKTNGFKHWRTLPLSGCGLWLRNRSNKGSDAGERWQPEPALLLWQGDAKGLSLWSVLTGLRKRTCVRSRSGFKEKCFFDSYLKGSITLLAGVWKKLHEHQFVVTLVVDQVVNQLLGHQNAKATGAQTFLFPNRNVMQRIVDRIVYRGAL